MQPFSQSENLLVVFCRPGGLRDGSERLPPLHDRKLRSGDTLQLSSA